MIGLVMAGGRGSRMGGGGEKLLLRYGSKPVVMHVMGALRDSGCLERVTAAVSPNSPGTARLLEQSGIETVETPGSGYVEDLAAALRSVAPAGDVLVSPGDLPLLDCPVVRQMAARYDPSKVWTSFVITPGFAESLGMPPPGAATVPGSRLVYSGISVVNVRKLGGRGGLVDEHRIVLDDKRIAFNLNTKGDYERLLLLGAA